MNWSVPEEKEKRFQHQEKWDTKSPFIFHDTGKRFTKEAFVVLVNIHSGTLKHYPYEDKI